MNLDNVLGGKFSIISKSGLRYVGTLLGIEGEQKTLSFEKVVSYGSEGRIGNGRDIPPSNNIFDFIIFKAEEIAHLKLIEPPLPKYEQNEIFTDPAIVQTGPKQASNQDSNNSTNTRPPRDPEQNYTSNLAPQDSFPQDVQESSHPAQQTPENNGLDRFENKSQYKEFQGGHRNNHNKNNRSNQRNGPRNNRGKPGLTIPEGDFDFQSFNAQFNKDELKKEFTSELGSGSDITNYSNSKEFYDKKTSFFDNISCDSKNKAGGQNSETFSQQRKNNFETFGVNSPNHNRHHSNRGSRGRNNFHFRNNGQGHPNRSNSNSMQTKGGNNDISYNPDSTGQ